MSQRFVKSALIGHPVAHSRSPLIHQYWMDCYDLQGLYSAIDLAPEDLKSGVRDLVSQVYKGFNVTIPHKESIMELCDDLDETAKNIGAVNSVVINDDGTLSGFNTDAYGFIQNIKTSALEFDFMDGSAVVLGAGGASRAVVYGLLSEGCPKVILINRTRETAQTLANECIAPDKVEIIDWDDRSAALENTSLLVNTTSLGMEGKAPLDLDLSALPVDALVNDIVYAPLETILLKDARERGNQTVSGIGMLLHQARAGFESWHGVNPEVTDALQKLVLA